jgi:hypothetical protein
VFVAVVLVMVCCFKFVIQRNHRQMTAVCQ